MQWVMVMVQTYLLRQADIRSSTGNERAPIQLAQCWFLGLVISNAKILIYFSNKIYGRNFIKQHSETVVVWNYQILIAVKRIYCAIAIVFGTVSFAIFRPSKPIAEKVACVDRGRL